MHYLLYFLLFIISKDPCHEKFWKEMLTSPATNEYVLVIAAKQKSIQFEIVLTNVELFQNLKAIGQCINEDLKLKIINGSYVLPIDDSSKLLTEVKYFKEIADASKKGKPHFIETYFDQGGYLKVDVPFKYVGHIVQVLIGWNVLINESEGNLHIYNKNFCQNLR